MERKNKKKYEGHNRRKNADMSNNKRKNQTIG